MADDVADLGEDLRPLFARSVEEEAVEIIDLLDDLSWFRGVPGEPSPASWAHWRVFLQAVYGLPMTDEETAIFQRFTGRKDPPTQKVSEVWGLCGRRARKTAIMALIGAWEGCFVQHRGVALGERARIPMISKDKDDAKQIRSHLLSIMNCRPMRGYMAKDPVGEEVNLTTNVDFMIRAVKITAGRGRAIPCVLLDEIAFWKSEDSAQPDVEVLAGIKPAMSTFEHPLLVAMSSVYSKQGVLWQAYQDHYRNENDPVLVWKASTLDMHDSPVVRAYVKGKMAEDPVSGRAEYESEFRDDIGPFVAPDVVDAAVDKGVLERPYDAKHPENYFAFVDPSGGAQDSMTLAIAHQANGKLLLDHISEWTAPFNPSVVIPQASAVLKEYRVRNVWGDRYGGIWVQEPFRLAGHQYIPCEDTKNEIYRNALPRLNAGNVRLLDNHELVTQLKKLERKKSRSGDIIDHPQGGHDDVANAAMGACWLADVHGRTRRTPEPEREPPKTTMEIYKRRMAEEDKQRYDGGADQGSPAWKRMQYRRSRR